MTPEPNPPKTLIVDLSNLYGGSSSRVLSLLTRFPAGTAALAGLERGAVTRDRLIRSEGYQALDSQNIQSKVFASLAASLTRAALVSTINSWYANEHGKASLKGKIYTAVELATNWNLSLYIAVSERDRQNLLRARIPEDDIALIYNAVDAAQPPPADRGFLRREFNLPTDSTVCLAVGRLVRVKGYDVLVEAIKQAASHMSNIVCVIVGEGEAHEELTRQIHEAGLDGRVILAGYLPRETIASALASCAVPLRRHAHRRVGSGRDGVSHSRVGRGRDSRIGRQRGARAAGPARRPVRARAGIDPPRRGPRVRASAGRERPAPRPRKVQPRGASRRDDGRLSKSLGKIQSGEMNVFDRNRTKEDLALQTERGNFFVRLPQRIDAARPRLLEKFPDRAELSPHHQS
ncbi:glycosyltransferase [Anaerolineae bacterium AMX1]|nr:glycosyltransferase [Anaerolineae bacterium AMX1]